MKSVFDNPYPNGTDEYLIWEVLVRNDFEGFLQGQWQMVADDYLADGFFGVDFGKSAEPTNWKLGFPSLESYRDQWLKDSHEFRQMNFAVDPRTKLYESCQLPDVQITGDSALVHKLFAGGIPLLDGTAVELKWRSLFLLRKQQESWRIAGFCGYLETKENL